MILSTAKSVLQVTALLWGRLRGVVRFLVPATNGQTFRVVRPSRGVAGTVAGMFGIVGLATLICSCGTSAHRAAPPSTTARAASPTSPPPTGSTAAAPSAPAVPVTTAAVTSTSTVAIPAPSGSSELAVLVVRPSVVASPYDFGVVRPAEIDLGSDVRSHIVSITWTYWTASSAARSRLAHQRRLRTQLRRGEDRLCPRHRRPVRPGARRVHRDVGDGQWTHDIGRVRTRFLRRGSGADIRRGRPADLAGYDAQLPDNPVDDIDSQPRRPGPTAGVDVFLSPSRNISCEIDYQRSGLPIRCTARPSPRSP